MAEINKGTRAVEQRPIPYFTVFTATYNRVHTLPRVYESLSAQTFKHFEWLVVDDGSTDGTAKLMQDWIKTAYFPIRYFHQPNSGKHIAHNFAVRKACGQFFTVIDSDDALMPRALERAHALWKEIPDGEQPKFCGVGGLCQDQQGRLVGDLFPASPFDTDFHEMVFIHRLNGERWATWRTDILRQYPFPEIMGTNWVPEGLVWFQIAKNYKHRFGNEVFRIYYIDDKNVDTNVSNRRNSVRCAAGRLHYSLWLLNHELSYFHNSPFPFIKAAAMIPVMSHYAGRPLHVVWRELMGWRPKLLVLALSLLALPLIIVHELKGQWK